MSTKKLSHKNKIHFSKSENLKIAPLKFTLVLLILLFGGFALGSMIGIYNQPTKASYNAVQYSNQAKAADFIEEPTGIYIDAVGSDSQNTQNENYIFYTPEMMNYTQTPDTLYDYSMYPEVVNYNQDPSATYDANNYPDYVISQDSLAQ